MQCSSILHPTNPILAPIITDTHSPSFVKHNSRRSFPVSAQFNRFQLKKSNIAHLLPQFLVTNKDNMFARLFPISNSTRVSSTTKSEATSRENENSTRPKIDKKITTISVHGLKLLKLETTSESYPNQTFTTFTVNGQDIFHCDHTNQAQSDHAESSPNQTLPPHTSKKDIRVDVVRWAAALIIDPVIRRILKSLRRV